MRVKIKICGITRYDDARIAANLGTDAVGFIFYHRSPRALAPAAAHEIIRQLPPFISKVGVFVNETVEHIVAVARAAGLDTIQLHGNESPHYCEQVPYPVIKAFSIDAQTDISLLNGYDTSGFLLDTWDEQRRGGTGKTFDWTIAEKAMRKFGRIILAGGLGPINLKDALDSVLPYGVDVNSGVELKPGIKNPRKMRDAINIVKDWRPLP
ncbi:MAG: phosphoribosylanthranilate isomerase [Chitinivibrionales bacterium]|nr:phosphoribosylanthranilate isomerase [Chitinivibrionales bacterium]